MSAHEYYTGSWGGDQYTQADGSYSITGLAPVSYRVEIDTYGTDYIREYFDSTYDHENAVPVFVTYHPAYLLRTPADKAKAWTDLKALRAALHAQ